MGIEAVILGISAVASTAFGVVGAVQAQRAAKEEEKARDTAEARDENRRREQLRQRVREERIKRAQIVQGAYNAGSAQSSGQIGATGALQSSLGGVFSFSRSEAKASQGINRANQNAANYYASSELFSSAASLARSAGSGFLTIFDELEQANAQAS